MARIPPLLPIPEWALIPIQYRDTAAVSQLEVRSRCFPDHEALLQQLLSCVVAVLKLDSAHALGALAASVLAEYADGERGSSQSARCVLAAYQLLQQRAQASTALLQHVQQCSLWQRVAVVPEEVSLPPVSSGWQLSLVVSQTNVAPRGELALFRVLANGRLPALRADGHITKLLTKCSNTTLLLVADGNVHGGMTFTVEAAQTPEHGEVLVADILLAAVSPRLQRGGIGSVLANAVKAVVRCIANQRGSSGTILLTQSDSGQQAMRFWQRQLLEPSDAASALASALNAYDPFRFENYANAVPTVLARAARVPLPLVAAVLSPPPPILVLPPPSSAPPPKPLFRPPDVGRLTTRSALARASRLSIFDLPAELLEIVVRFADRVSLRALARTCQQVAQAARQEVWEVAAGSSWQLIVRLHVAGWVILTCARDEPMDAELIGRIHRRGLRSQLVIFNGDRERKRRQHRDVAWADEHEQWWATELRRCGLLQMSDRPNLKTVADMFALTSLKKCKAQPPHGDVAAVGTLDHLPAGDVPLSGVRAIMPGSSLLMYENGCGHLPRRVSYGLGKMMIFLGDYPHAGDKSADSNSRLHAYIDSPAVHRPPDSTHLCEASGDSSDDDPSSDWKEGDEGDGEEEED